MIERIRAIAARVDGMTLRERTVGFMAALAVLYFAWDAVLFAPLDARRAALVARVAQAQEAIATVNTQIGKLAGLRSADPDLANRRTLTALRAESERLAGSLAEVTDRLIPPNEMAALLESLIVEQRALNLVRLEGLGVETVGSISGGAPVENGSPTSAIPGLYRHGLRVVVSGNYLDALAYLRSIESLRWGLLWDSVRVEVKDHPVAEISLTVFSLSLDDGWIGV